MNNEKILVTRASLPKKEDFIKLVNEIFDNAWLTNMGCMHKRLEEELRKYLDVENVSLFVNGHQALELLIEAFELQGEVITTPFSFISTSNAIVRNNLKPVFCDIKEDDYTIDPNKIESLINEKTSAILATHVYGNICDNEALEKIAKKYNIKLIYDAAHAFYEKYNNKSVANLGDASMFSFHATKVYNTIEGGAVCSKHKDIHKKLYYLKNFGIEDKETVSYIGSNAKMNEFQAAMGLCNLKYIKEWIDKRKIIADTYIDKLKDIKGIKINIFKENQTYNYSYFPIVFTKEYKYNRNQVYEILGKHNIYARKYFYPAINELKVYKDLGVNMDTPISTEISKNILCLPIYPDLDIKIVKKICELIKG